MQNNIFSASFFFCPFTEPRAEYRPTYTYKVAINKSLEAITAESDVDRETFHVNTSHGPRSELRGGVYRFLFDDLP